MGERERLDNWVARVARAANQQLSFGQQRLGSLAGRLEALSPLNVLARGYSLTRDESSQVVRSFDQVHAGDRVQIQLQRGHLVGRVEECHAPEALAAVSTSENKS
jgi:exodeoxyribonuclease VII large subunit